MSEDTHLVPVMEQQEQPVVLENKPAREMSQAAIASFFYGTLQLLVTTLGSVLAVAFFGAMKSLTPATTQSAQGTDIANAEELQKMIDTLETLDPENPIDISSIPIESSPPDDPALIGPTAPPETNPLIPFMPEGSANEIIPFEVLVILGCSGFALLSIITALVAFRATGKGGNKTGRGLALTGLISSLASLGIAAAAALAI